MPPGQAEQVVSTMARAGKQKITVRKHLLRVMEDNQMSCFETFVTDMWRNESTHRDVRSAILDLCMRKFDIGDLPDFIWQIVECALDFNQSTRNFVLQVMSRNKPGQVSQKI